MARFNWVNLSSEWSRSIQLSGLYCAIDLALRALTLVDCPCLTLEDILVKLLVDVCALSSLREDKLSLTVSFLTLGTKIDEPSDIFERACILTATSFFSLLTDGTVKEPASRK